VFPNVGGTIIQSPQISVPHQSNAVCDRSIYGGNGSISIDYSQIRSAIASYNNSNFMLVNLFFLQTQEIYREHLRMEEKSE